MSSKEFIIFGELKRKCKIIIKRNLTTSPSGLGVKSIFLRSFAAYCTKIKKILQENDNTNNQKVSAGFTN